MECQTLVGLLTDMDKNSSDMEDEIFDIVTDLLRDDMSKTEAIDKLLVLSNVRQQRELLIAYVNKVGHMDKLEAEKFVDEYINGEGN